MISRKPKLTCRHTHYWALLKRFLQTFWHWYTTKILQKYIKVKFSNIRIFLEIKTQNKYENKRLVDSSLEKVNQVFHESGICSIDRAINEITGLMSIRLRVSNQDIFNFDLG